MMRTPSLFIPALFLLAGCMTESPSEWNLVGVYDPSALAKLGAPPPEEDATPSAYVWVPAGHMRQTCGPAKSPDGMGLFDAESMANGLTPTLAILLERDGEGDGSITPQDVRISLGRSGEPEFELRPAVNPRYISLRIDGDADIRPKQLVRTQFEMELCMEHKTGRGWIGGDHTQLRQAFLLDPPIGGADRKYFGGQRDPVPPLLGPPDACIQYTDTAPVGAGDASSRGDGSLELVPSDVWGASLRWCGVEEVGDAFVRGVKPVPLTLGVTEGRPLRMTSSRWRELTTTLHVVDVTPTDPGQEPTEVRVDMTFGDAVVLDDQPLHQQPEGGVGEPGLTDLLEQVPYEYPMLGTHDDPFRYTILLVPNWQIVEGLRRMDAARLLDNDEELDKPRGDGGLGIQDGVGYVLDHPELLFVQLPKRGTDGSNPNDWLNLAQPLAGGPLGWNRWGSNPGMLSGRRPVALFGAKAPVWGQVMLAHNTSLNAFVLGSLAVLFGLLLLGLRRMSDLWTTVPEERVDFWPRVLSEEEEAAEGDGEAPEMPSGG